MDERRGFAGTGPKGYTRSDERIFEDVCAELTRHDELDARWLRVTVRGGEVILDGSVDSRDAKFLAEEIVAQVAGVADVDNRLKVTHAESAYDRELSHGLFGRLIEEHRLLDAMFDIVIATPAHEATDRLAAFRTLARELLVHGRAESEIVYDALDGAYELGHRIDELERDHQAIEVKIAEIDAIADGGERWLALVKSLRTEVQQHVRVEEEEVFRRALVVLDEIHRADLLVMYEQDRAVQMRRLDEEERPLVPASPRTVEVEEAHRTR